MTPIPYTDSKLPESVALPIQGRPERMHLYRWVQAEEEYVANKFDDQRDGHDQSLATLDIDDFWFRQIVQYYDRARVFLNGAKSSYANNDPDSAREMELRAQQAMVKAMMTAKGLVESSIRVFGNLPMPGVSSGNIEEWDG